MARRKSKEEWKTYDGVFDKHTVENLKKMSAQGHFEEIVGTLALGKEANILIGRRKDDSYVIIKVYRLENCNFNKMYSYLSQDPRYDFLRGNRRRIIFEWTKREYRNLQKARECIKVPSPYAFRDNIIVMEYIGGTEAPAPAPELKDVKLKEPDRFFERVIEDVKRLYAKGMVHGDLSSFNILVDGDQPVFIDFSQGTMAPSLQLSKLLLRDLTNITTYFRKSGVEKDPRTLFTEITGAAPPPEDL